MNNRAAAGTSSAEGPSNGSPPSAAYYSDPFAPSPRNLLSTPTTCAEFFCSFPDFELFFGRLSCVGVRESEGRDLLILSTIR
jgi:hypothetical protein